MSAEDHDRKRDARRNEARARMVYGARIAWLGGFPVETAAGFAFQSVPRCGEAALVPLDPAFIGRAVRAFREIERDLGSSRGGLRPEDLAPCWDRVEPALALLGLAVRAGSVPPPWSLLSRRAVLFGERLARDAALRSIVHAAGWASALSGDELAAFEWLAGVAAELRALVSIGPPGAVDLVAVALARLAIDGEARGAARLLSLLGDPVIHATQTFVVSADGEPDTSDSPDAVGPAAATLGASLLALVPRLLAVAGGGHRRRLVLELAVDAAPIGLVRAWAEWTRAATQYAWDLAAAKRLRAQRIPRVRKPRLPEPMPTPPPPFAPERFASALLNVALLDSGEAEALAAAVRALPLGNPEGTRAHALVVFRDWLREGASHAREKELLLALAELLAEEGEPAQMILGWRAFSRGASQMTGDASWIEGVDGIPPNVQITDYLRALAPISAEPAARYRIVLYEEIVEQGRAPGFAAACALGVHPSVPLDALPGYAGRGPVVFALELAGDDAATATRLLSRILAGDGPRSDTGARRLVALMRRLDALSVLVDEALFGSIERLTHLAEALAAVEPERVRVELRAPSESDLGALLTRYPAPLHDALRALARLPDVDERARRLLRRVLPDEQALATELRAIEERLRDDDRPRLRARAAALGERLRAGRALRPAQLRKLDNKVRRAARDGILGLIAAAVTDQLADSVWPSVPAGSLPDWWLRTDTLELIAAIGELKEPERTLGRSLLRLRAGPPPWLPWDLPANRRFLERLSARGIDPAPWLDERATTSVLDGSPLALRLESDPLEILRMGEHFSTCLSIGSFNFFATIANAVDVNKRVLYGRAASGTVLARCLLALTDDGRILTFEPYAHDPKLRFGERVAAFAAALARDMGTQIASSGAVSTIVARNWYDDGSRDLTGRLTCLADGTPLRQALASRPAAAAIAEFMAALAPAGLDEPALSRFLDLPEVAARPELVAALLPRLAAGSSLPPGIRIRIAAGLVGSHPDPHPDHLALASSVLRAPGLFVWLTAPCTECAPRMGCQPNLDALMGLLVRLDPFLLLRALRRTRERSVRGLKDEPEVRRRAAADALRALGRHADADRLERAPAK